LEIRIPWARGAVTGTGKKLELGLRKKYFGPERDFPGSSGLGEPNGGGQGETPGGGRRSRRGGVSGDAGQWGQGGPGRLHQGAQNGSGDEQLVSVAPDFSRPCVSNVQKAKAKNCMYFHRVEFNGPKLCAITSS